MSPIWSMSRIELAVPRDQLAHRPSSFTSGLETLPIRYEARAAAGR